MELHYNVQGSGDPIVLLHSPGVDMRVWKFVVPQLAHTKKVITFDGRGTGQSPSPTKPLDLVHDLLMLLDHLGIEKTVLVGHSMGGQISTDFSLLYPSRVEKLILIAPSLTGFQYSSEFTSWMAQVNAAAPDVEKLTNLSLQGPIYSVTMSGPHCDFLYELTHHYMKKVFTEWKNFEVIWPQPPAIERLHDISADTLFIRGTVEWADIDRVGELFKQVPSIRFVTIDDADHMVPLTHPDELSRQIQKFIENE
ncbi:alpha/beta hydrolase [Paenibacillus sp. KQZ6P-2]|uniref:Alpha/beta hydrolase n=1 Tax=Paenibacillus mangrovi TaxID=2931978 RepID=A0A9X2B793_9BACL|nr:alpha/beta hydrolase [Paenibacillus mangrovi]MCJ8014702.1 alpha/beta hydrolase [Paenibacillus mangrovi]